MKQILFIFCFLVNSLVSLVQGPQPSKLFLPDNKIFDFGTVLEKKGKVSHTFLIRNIGFKPIVINNVSAWCGCTEIDYTKRPILPRQTGKVTVVYNPYSRVGFFSKEIVVLTEGGNNYTRLWIKGRVIPYLHPVKEDYPYAYGSGLYMSHKILSFGVLKKRQSQSIELRIANNNDKPMIIVFKKYPNNSLLQMPHSLKLKAKQRVKINVIYKDLFYYNHRRHINVYPMINGKKLNPLKITWLPNK